MANPVKAWRSAAMTLLLLGGVARAAHRDGGVLLYYGDRALPVGGYTMVRYADAQRIIARLSARAALGTHPMPPFLGTGVAPPGWRPRGRVGPRAFYRHVLNGAILQFVRCKVAKAFAKEYPKDRGVARGDASLRRATKWVARESQRASGVWDTAFLQGQSGRQLVAAIRHSFPHWRKRIVEGLALGLPLLRRYGLDELVAHRCAPWFRKGRVAPWFRDQCYADILADRFDQKVRRHGAFFARLVDDRFGKSAYFVVSLAHAADLNLLARLLGAVSRPDGTIFTRPYGQAQRVLGTLGSTTTLMGGDLNHVLMRAELHLRKMSLLPGVFIPIPPAHTPQLAYLYIFQLQPTHAFPNYPNYGIGRGNFLYQRAMSYVLRPLIARVLGRTRPGPGLRLPHPSQVLRSYLAPDPFPKQMFGDPVPQVSFPLQGKE